MKPEEAKKQLEQFLLEVPDGELIAHQYFPAVRKLPKKLRTVAFDLLDFDENEADWDDRDWVEREEASWVHAQTLDAMSPRDRGRIWKVLFGPLADAVETAWQQLKQAPYGEHYEPTVFRAPSAPIATLKSRRQWVAKLYQVTRMCRNDILTPRWLAMWTPYIFPDYYSRENELGRFLATVIESGGSEGEKVFEILCQSARGEHSIGAMGRHVIIGLLGASRESGWELMENMLRAAKRQEGLRQTIFECLAFAHPEAFRRMLAIIEDENLVRFASVVQAVDQWFSYSWAASAKNPLRQTLATARTFLSDPKERDAALESNDPERIYLALWSLAFADIHSSLAAAEPLLHHADADVRLATALHLTCLNHAAANELRRRALDDEDLHVAMAALSGFDDSEYGIEEIHGPGTFAAIERLIERLPKKPKKLTARIWPWTERTIARRNIGSMLINAARQTPEKLLPHLSELGPWERDSVAELLVERRKWDDITRQTLVQLVGDTSADVRSTALRGLQEAGIRKADAEVLEAYLGRKSSDLRAGVVSLLAALPDADAFESAKRLCSAKAQLPRLAGLELVRQLAEADRGRDACIRLATEFRDGRSKVLKAEAPQLEAILASDRPVITLDNALGLLDADDVTPTPEPRKRKVKVHTKAAVAAIESLDALVHEHRHDTVKWRSWVNHDCEEVLSEIHYEMSSPKPNRSIREQLVHLPHQEVWLKWLESRPKATRDTDGLELLRAMSLLAMNDSGEELDDWARKDASRAPVRAILRGDVKVPKIRYEWIVSHVLEWVLLLQIEEHPPKTSPLDFALDVTETIFATLPESALHATSEYEDYHWDDVYSDFRRIAPIEYWVRLADELVTEPRQPPTQDQLRRHWQLLRFFQQPIPAAIPIRPLPRIVAHAFSSGVATHGDLTDQLLGPRHEEGWSHPFLLLEDLTARRPPKWARELRRDPKINKLVQSAVDRVYEVEIQRGEARTAASMAAYGVRDFGGSQRLLALLTALGKTPFKREPHWSDRGGANRAVSFTAMIARTWPAESDTERAFAKAARAAVAAEDFPEERLIQLAFLAPQWIAFLEAALGWPGMTEAVYWYLAHMNYVYGLDEQIEGEDEEDEDLDSEDDEDDLDAPRKLSRWERIIRERTDLTDSERSDGAIDVAWFHRVYKVLGAQRWEALATGARFAASPAQAKRAKMIGDVLLGEIPKTDLVAGIEKKHLKENVRLLGLLPLAKGKQREIDLLDRYEVLQAYRKYAGGLSSMTKPEALRAVDIGMHNLAATAGYADPMRLQWAMEASSTADLAKGPVVEKKGEVTLTLALDESANPTLTIQRGERVLKSLPKDVKKNAKFLALRERGKHLKQQSSRVKQSLEIAMCRGDAFTGKELMQLADHAILWPQLSRLVLVGEGILGYPEKSGKALRDHAGKLEPVRKTESFRIAHPHDLLKTKAWQKWQRDCFAREILQPFKQVFRELYVVTAQEKKDKLMSRRYAGLQVHERQSRALWGRREWSTDEYGDVFKAFPGDGISANVVFEHGITTPLEYEGSTLEGVTFHDRDSFKDIPLTKVPPRIFSEVMRDMDLVVSVAHTGEVDPEATASTVEMRATLLKETCQLLKLKNVKVKAKDSRAIIQGELGEYTVHLGSGVVHRLPGGSVCIVPVHGQRRGRIFLPFADDDPRTAEVIAKTLLLARDGEIEDPIILEQLRAMA